MSRHLLLAILLPLAAVAAPPIPDSPDFADFPEANPAPPPPAPVAHWTFDPEARAAMQAHGDIQWDEPGPSAPEFPDFPQNDRAAVRINGKGSHLSLPDPSPSLQARNGDVITLESWIKLHQIKAGQGFYIIGKGRTGQPGFPQDNLNWSLRVSGSDSEAHLNFLFNTIDDSGKTQWHRWTSELGFTPSTGWHHLVLSYRFGDPDSIKGWIDGLPTTGSWDMAGKTKRQPHADTSDLWIGSSFRRDDMVSFNGWIHSIRVYRSLLDDAQVASRFDRAGGPLLAVPQPEVMPNLPALPQGRVQMIVAEKMPTYKRWPNQGEPAPVEVMRWTGDAFLLHRLPQRYDEIGVRSDWQAPLLLTLAADAPLPPGKQKILLRVRGLARLWIDGKLIARGQPDVARQVARGGRNPLVMPQPPLPGLRAVQEYMQEVIVEADVPAPAQPGAPHRIVLEQVVGADGLRTQTGETLVALLDKNGKTYHILQPGKPARLPLTDAAVNAFVKKQETFLTSFDDTNRREQARSQDAFWDKRHALAQQWAQEHPAPAIPSSTGKSAPHPIDAFLQAKIDKTLKSTANGKDTAGKFHDKILPLLQEHCFRCHGEKDRGGLKLDTRDAALLAGDSGSPAIIPGDPKKSELIARLHTDDESLKMPPKGEGLSPDQVKTLETWIRDGAVWPAAVKTQDEIAFAPLVSDEAFLRRVHFDLTGLPPGVEDIRAFAADTRPDKRERVIDRLLRDERGADHWISFWQDLLAENPSLIGSNMNSTGPFRWFLHEALRDRKPLDRMITELLQMRGSLAGGGSIGFGEAGENDAPFAEKGHIVASAFLGVELQCARCHDSPYHSTTQKDLFALAAMMSRKPVTVPASSRVPAAFFENSARASLIKVTLRPDEKVLPQWPFADETGVTEQAADRLAMNADDSRDRLAALMTAPENRRFAKVMVNRLWKRLMGAGIVEPVHDWEGREASHPELLDWLAHQFVAHGYDFHHVLRLIATSQAYQREATGDNLAASAKERYFQAPDRRRLGAEQIADAMHAATGRAMDVEELTFDPYGRWPAYRRMTLGHATRAWMMVDLKNERDRPSLSLPKARAVLDVMEAFGWVGARQKPVSERETEANVLQPGILANSVLSTTLTRAAKGSRLAELAVEASHPNDLVETLFLSILNRQPNPQERAAFSEALAQGFEQRLADPSKAHAAKPLPPLPRINWLNHANPEANTIQEEYERRVRQGGEPDPRLQTAWRNRYEDLVWSLINHREFVWLP